MWDVQVALDVVGITPLTIPSFRLIWAEPKDDEVSLARGVQCAKFRRSVARRCVVQDFATFVKKSALVIDGGVAGKRIRVPLSHVRGSEFTRQVGSNDAGIVVIGLTNDVAVAGARSTNRIASRHRSCSSRCRGPACR
jgi:hypothetical protein